MRSVKTYFISPLKKQSMFARRQWTKGGALIFEYCRWVDGMISISVPSTDPTFDPYLIIKNANNDWRKYAYEIIEGFDGSIEWDYGDHFKRDEWLDLATKMESDIREELDKLGWSEGPEELFIEGEIELETDETRKVRNNYNLEW
tara:strand:- start:361 stop:795 length:435 start_codon:yes stop_codon:yes gene_type:complete